MRVGYAHDARNPHAAALEALDGFDYAQIVARTEFDLSMALVVFSFPSRGQGKAA